MKKYVLKVFAALVIACAAYMTILWNAEIFFSHQHDFQNIRFFSDEPIDSQALNSVLKSSLDLLNKSPLFHPDRQYRVFNANSNWRRLIFLRGWSAAGGIYQPPIPATYLGAINIEKNLLLKPDGMPAPPERSLSYFIAHEITHQLTAEHLGGVRFYFLPMWISEGYADYIAKGDSFDDFAQVNLLKNKAPQTDIWKTEFDDYNLLVTYLLEKKKVSLSHLFADFPTMQEVETEILKESFAQ